MNKKEGFLALWRECFTDSEPFIRLYFDRLYRDDSTRVIEQDGKIIAALQILPYALTLCGKSIPTAYLSGVCTAPAFRRQGIMSRLMSETFDFLKRQGYPLSLLIPAEPWLFDYYGRMGYAPLFLRRDEPITPLQDCSEQMLRFGLEQDPQRIYPYFDRVMSQRELHVRHHPEVFATACIDHLQEGGIVLSAQDRQGALCGLLWAVFPTEGECLIRERIGETRSIEEALTGELMRRYPRCSFRMVQSGKGAPWAMLRTIDPAALCRTLNRTEEELPELFDPQRLHLSMMME